MKMSDHERERYAYSRGAAMTATSEPKRPKCECGHAYEDHASHHFDDVGHPSCMKPACQNPHNPRRCSGYFSKQQRTS